MVTDESASMAEPGEIQNADPRFHTFKEAWAYANTQYSEYGISCDFPIEITEVIPE